MGLTGGPATASGRGPGPSEVLPAVKDGASNATRHTIVNAAATKRRRCTGVRQLGARKYTPALLSWVIHFGASRARRGCFGPEGACGSRRPSTGYVRRSPKASVKTESRFWRL